MTDVPSGIKFGSVTGRFVQYVEDSTDALTLPDQVGLNGTGTLVPSVNGFRITSGPNAGWVSVAAIPFKIVNGDILSQANLPIFLIASEQPLGDVSLIQWTAAFNLVGVSVQPATVTFNVTDGGVTDLSQVLSGVPLAGEVIVFESRPREVLVLGPAVPVPAGTAPGTVIIRTAS